MATEASEPRSRLSRWLAHPASLLILTAVLTGLLAPWITNRWEARDKQVEAQRAASERRMEAQRAASDGPEARAEYRALKKSALEIASQLAAYFPNSRPVVRWRDYTYSLRNAYILLTAPVGRARNVWLDRLDRYFDVLPTQLDGLCFPSTSSEFAGDLRELVLAFQNKEEAVVREVAASPTVLTGTPTRDVNVPRKHYDPKQNRPCDPYF